MRVNDLHVDSGVGKLLWLGVWGPINLVFAFLPLLALNLLQFPSLLVLPFSKRLFRAYNRIPAMLIWGWWAWAVEHIVGLKVHFSGDDVPAAENAVVIANHQGMGDILVLLCLAIRKKRIGDLKWIVKDGLKYVPGLGWGMLFIECVFLKRAWAKDETRIIHAFKKYKDAEIPVWMMMFPEGTRFTPAKLAASQTFATKAGLTPYRRLLIPRTKGFSTAVNGLRTHVSAVYSVTIGYPGKAPSLVSLIRGDVKEVSCHVRRHPIASLPEDDKALADWLMRDFREKDALMTHFEAQGTFS